MRTIFSLLLVALFTNLSTAWSAVETFNKAELKCKELSIKINKITPPYSLFNYEAIITKGNEVLTLIGGHNKIIDVLEFTQENELTYGFSVELPTKVGQVVLASEEDFTNMKLVNTTCKVISLK
jgi:hypothetical protein